MKVLITGAFSDYEKLKEEVPDNEYFFVQNELNKLDIDVSDIEYVICNSLFLYNDVSLFKSLKYIQVTSSGLDRLPIDYIEKNNIKIFNARGVYSVPMAEWTVCKILDVYKKSFDFYSNQKEHLWKKDRNVLELDGKVATIVGYGSVGEEIAKRLIPFGVEIIAVNKDNIENINEYVKKSNIIIITLPLTKETEGLFNESIFQEINNCPVLVNVARGKLINTSDLVKYHDKFLSIILDVFEEEPLEETSELWSLDNIIITPHNSFVGEKNNERLYNVVKESLINL